MTEPKPTTLEDLAYEVLTVQLQLKDLHVKLDKLLSNKGPTKPSEETRNATRAIVLSAMVSGETYSPHELLKLVKNDPRLTRPIELNHVSQALGGAKNKGLVVMLHRGLWKKS